MSVFIEYLEPACLLDFRLLMDGSQGTGFLEIEFKRLHQAPYIVFTVQVVPGAVWGALSSLNLMSFGYAMCFMEMT